MVLVVGMVMMEIVMVGDDWCWGGNGDGWDWS